MKPNVTAVLRINNSFMFLRYVWIRDVALVKLIQQHDVVGNKASVDRFE